MMDYFVRWKVYAQRSLIYYQLIQYVLIVILFLRPYNLNFWFEVILILGIGAVAILIGRLDTKLKILEKEQGHFNKENKELREIRDLLLEIKNERRNNNSIYPTCDPDNSTNSVNKR
jgi:hypothetical protein